jgi:hypothetical protein
VNGPKGDGFRIESELGIESRV